MRSSLKPLQTVFTLPGMFNGFFSSKLEIFHVVSVKDLKSLEY